MIIIRVKFQQLMSLIQVLKVEAIHTSMFNFKVNCEGVLCNPVKVLTAAVPQQWLKKTGIYKGSSVQKIINHCQIL